MEKVYLENLVLGPMPKACCDRNRRIELKYLIFVEPHWISSIRSKNTSSMLLHLYHPSIPFTNTPAPTSTFRPFIHPFIHCYYGTYHYHYISSPLYPLYDRHPSIHPLYMVIFNKQTTTSSCRISILVSSYFVLLGISIVFNVDTVSRP